MGRKAMNNPNYPKKTLSIESHVSTQDESNLHNILKSHQNIESLLGLRPSQRCNRHNWNFAPQAQKSLSTNNKKKETSSTSSNNNKFRSEDLLDTKVFEALARHPLVINTLVRSHVSHSKNKMNGDNSRKNSTPSHIRHISEEGTTIKDINLTELDDSPETQEKIANKTDPIFDCQQKQPETQVMHVVTEEKNEIETQISNNGHGLVNARHDSKFDDLDKYCLEENPSIQSDVVAVDVSVSPVSADSSNFPASNEIIVYQQMDVLHIPSALPVIDKFINISESKVISPQNPSKIRGYLSSLVKVIQPAVQAVTQKISNCMKWGLETRPINALVTLLSKLIALFMIMIPSSMVMSVLITFKRIFVHHV